MNTKFNVFLFNAYKRFFLNFNLNVFYTYGMKLTWLALEVLYE